VPLLLEHFFTLLAGTPSPLAAAALQRLCNYAWPGNVRELRNMVDRLRIHWPHGRGELSLAQMQAWLPELASVPTAPPAAADAMPGGVAQRAAARPGNDALQQLLDDHGGNREQVAQRLGVSRTTLWRWLRSTTG